jgi:hypothetical protein
VVRIHAVIKDVLFNAVKYPGHNNEDVEHHLEKRVESFGPFEFHDIEADKVESEQDHGRTDVLVELIQSIELRGSILKSSPQRVGVSIVDCREENDGNEVEAVRDKLVSPVVLSEELPLGVNDSLDTLDVEDGRVRVLVGEVFNELLASLPLEKPAVLENSQAHRLHVIHNV